MKGMTGSEASVCSLRNTLGTYDTSLENVFKGQRGSERILIVVFILQSGVLVKHLDFFFKFLESPLLESKNTQHLCVREETQQYMMIMGKTFCKLL